MALITGKLQTDGKGNFIDLKGRKVQLKGINVDGGAKFPQTPYLPSHRHFSDTAGLFFDGDNVSFVGRPFPLSEAASHFRRIKSLGYNTIRYIVTWEAIEHKGPGIYDDEFIDYTIEILKIAQRVGGLYIYLDPHQDVWSRHSGGDGAPMWTLYAAGFDPKSFHKTEAALVQNFFPEDPDKYPKMLWPTNYRRLVAGTMFVLFFAGKTFAPKAIINGVNIQDYLQSHFIEAIVYFVKQVYSKEPSLFEETILGVETMNEPNSGYIGTPAITQIPQDQNLRLGTCPTFFQSAQLGMGIPVEVDEYIISVTGPKKTGSKLVDPEDTIAWLTDDHYDKHYGFQRSKAWKLGECIWAQHGVWDSDKVEPLIVDYFFRDPATGVPIDEDVFINTSFVDFYAAFRKSVREILPDTIIFIQPPPLQIPPKLRGTDLIDNNTVFCPHYYDGMSLMFKSWNSRYNVNTLGILRNRYWNPVFGISFGESAIRRSFKSQLTEMKREGQENLGEGIPIIFSEIGMPFDMDDKKAYDNDDFSSQTSALDALGFALEGSNLSHSWWCYTSTNCHRWGDRFNCEDFSFWSRDDDIDTTTTTPVISLNKREYSERAETISGFSSNSLFDSDEALELDEMENIHQQTYYGLRAADSTIRPYAIAINGVFIDAEFDLKKLTYHLEIKGSKTKRVPTTIYVPKWHFCFDAISIEQSSGSIHYDENKEVLEWFHESDTQSITIRNIEKSNEGKQNFGDNLLNFLFCLV